MPTKTTPATKTVTRRKPTTGDSRKTSFPQRFVAFLNLKAQTEQAENHQEKLKADLKGDVEEFGYKDAEGSFWLELDEPVEAYFWNDKTETLETKKFSKVKNQRRAPRKLNPDVAEQLLAKKGILEDCQTTIVVLDPDAIERKLFEGEITKSEFERMFPQSVSYAFTPQKG